jgi:hypothetical protein
MKKDLFILFIIFGSFYVIAGLLWMFMAYVLKATVSPQFYMGVSLSIMFIAGFVAVVYSLFPHED